MVIRSCTTKTRDLNPSRHLVDFSGARGQIAVVILDYIYSVAQPLRNVIDGDARRYKVTGKASAHIVDGTLDAHTPEVSLHPPAEVVAVFPDPLGLLGP